MKSLGTDGKGQVLEGIAEQFGLVPLDDTYVPPGGYIGGSISIGAAWKTIIAEQVCIGGVWKTVTLKQVCIGGAWKTLV